MGMQPLTIEGSSTRARKVLVGGASFHETTGAFVVQSYDVTGDAPNLVASTTSDNFTLSSLTNMGWALSPDGRFAAIVALNVGSSSTTHAFVIYDSLTACFGEITVIDSTNAGSAKQVVWIDATHFVVGDVAETVRGIRVFARSGLSVVDLGFFGVWGSGSASSTAVFDNVQFTNRSAGGVYAFVVDQMPQFTTITMRPLTWKAGALSVGEAVTVSSGTKPSVTTGLIPYLIRTDDDAFILFIGTTSKMMMMSFSIDDDAVTITRAWQTLVNDDTSYTSESCPVLFGGTLIVVQSYGDSYYSLAEITIGESSFSLSSDGAKVLPYENGYEYYGAVRLDGSRFLMQVVGGSYDTLATLGIVRRRTTGATLEAIVGDILDRAGYASSDYDVSALAATSVDGYILEKPMKASTAIAPLQVYEPFDLIESEAQLKAVLHTTTATLTLSDSAVRASVREAGEEAVPSSVFSRVQELDLPAQVTVDYMDTGRDYETGTQRARRAATRGASSVVTLSLPIACSASTAKQIAEKRLFTAWAERDETEIALPRSWITLDPGDVVAWGNRSLRLSTVKEKDGVLTVNGVLVGSSVVTSSATGDAGDAERADSSLSSVASALYLMDMPLLRAVDDQPGVYAAVSGPEGWRGAVVWRAADGVNFARLASFSYAASAGNATSVLADASPYYKDRANSVTVQLMQGSLASCTEAELMNGANVALLGNEIVQFQTATLVGPLCYVLSNLLRGRRGTEAAIGTHALDDSFVVLDENALQFLPCQLSDRSVAYAFAAVSSGRTLGSSASESFAYRLGSLCPYAPVHITGTRASGAGSDLTLAWKRRARKNAEWVDYIDVPLDEDDEIYDVDIMDGTAVLRTFSGLTTATVTYTADAQASDWGTAIPSLQKVRVYQVSARYGRGTAGAASV
jgi:hypothetical protein